MQNRFGDTVEEPTNRFGDTIQPDAVTTQSAPAFTPFGAVPANAALAPDAAKAQGAGISMQDVKDLVVPVTQGATFGFADEIGSVLRSAVLDETREEALQKLRERDEGVRERMGPGFTIAEVGGALIPSIVGGAPAVAALPARIPAAARVGLVGAAEGALVGAGTADGDLRDRAEGAAKGAAIGGAIGVGGTLTAQAVSALGQRLIRRFGGSNRRAASQVVQALERDEISPDEAFRRLRELGDDATIIDVGGENMLGLARATQSIPGQGKNRIAATLNARQAGQEERVIGVASNALAPGSEFRGSLDDLLTRRAAQARPNYQAAYDAGIDMTDDLRRVLQRPATRQAWERAQEMARNADVDLPRVFIKGPDGELTLNTEVVPNMQAIDWIKQGLDDIVETGRDQLTGAIRGGRLRSIDRTRKDLLEIVDELNPLYPQARAAYAGSSASIDALRQGRRLANSLNRGRGTEEFDPDAILSELGRMTDADKEFFRAGFAKGIQDIAESTTEGTNTALRVIGTTQRENRIRAAFPDEESFNRFISEMQREVMFGQSRGAVLGNSVTARAQAEQADLLSEAGGTLANVATGNVNQEAIGALQRLIRRTIDGPRNASLSSSLADVLAVQGPQAERALQRLLAEQPLPPSLQRATLGSILAGSSQAGSQ